MFEYLVKAVAEITDENGEVRGHQNFELNVFADSEDEAIEKADDNIREHNQDVEDSAIAILEIKKL